MNFPRASSPPPSIPVSVALFCRFGKHLLTAGYSANGSLFSARAFYPIDLPEYTATESAGWLDKPFLIR